MEGTKSMFRDLYIIDAYSEELSVDINAINCTT